MPDAKILATTVTPNASGAIVELQISDAPLDAEVWAIRLNLSVQIPDFDLPLLAHLQREAMRIADKALDALTRAIEREVLQTSHNVSPAVKK
ncbi:MAG: hypothetical protein ACHQRJ_05785 [Alphaproteobacteria bacterium]